MKFLFIILTSLALTGCATSTKKSIAQDRKSVGPIHNEKELMDKGRQILENSKLTKKQKDQFIAIYNANRKEALNLEDQIREYRAVLLKTLVAKKFDQRKFDITSLKIKKLIIQRYELSMKQYRQGKKILGVDAVHVYDDPWFEIMHKF
ncbi:hypothetical protein BIY24_09410 [Halobacteriovorax marinus]|uniref:Lipoprotein n=1 Tax=Halobacteriovorax marinus (strain ATCC BAA-682 / DSM 15412 / SJ) TaxID=862908 RepID=E1X2Z0_HALMS|nr:hypothetical protein [Halobacteriovorax marinus]ATH08157.1 hypothetical protein BIY24_09410 [Halobacteriovorax marinus]CBW26820.1 hypothetical protein BMS_2008 [Halobacteriovorax marinus SJ]